MNVAEILHKPVLPALIASLADLTPEIIQALVEKSAEWKEARAKRIGGSDANMIMGSKVFRLWQERTGRIEPEDLSMNLNVVMGTYTEPLNRYFFEKITGLLTEPPSLVIHPEYEFLGANLDGICNGLPWEAKHTGQFVSESNVVERYYPQLQHQMMVMGAPQAILSVFFGNSRYQTFTVQRDLEYQQHLMTQEMKFWQCVETDTPPDGFGTAPVSINMNELVTVDMTGNNAWASFAGAWKDNKDAAKLFEDAGKQLRALMPTNASLATGHGVQISRSKDNKLYVKEA